MNGEMTFAGMLQSNILNNKKIKAFNNFFMNKTITKLDIYE